MAIRMGTLEAGAELATPGPGRGSAGPVGRDAGPGRAARIDGRAARLAQDGPLCLGRAAGGAGPGKAADGPQAGLVAIVN